jgi:type IV pilus assembly protein PilM
VIERFRPSQRPIVCLDFGRDQLTAVEVLNGTVTRWASRPLPPDALRSGDPAHPPALGELIRRTLVRSSIQAREVLMALPDEASVSRLLVLPKMPRWDLIKAVQYAAERNIPFPIKRACWSWDVVDRTRDQIRVYIVAAWRDVVEHYAEAAKFAGLEPRVLEPRSIAVARAVDRDEALLVDAGTHRFHAMLLVGGQPAFVDEAETGTTDDEQREALDRLLQRAFRHQSSATDAAGRRLAPVLFAGDLEHAQVSLPVPGRPVSDVLNGQLPTAPRGFRPGAYLANLGLSMRSIKR